MHGFKGFMYGFIVIFVFCMLKPSNHGMEKVMRKRSNILSLQST